MTKPLIFAIDIDGTICDEESPDYKDREPLPGAIEYLNNLKQAGHYIILHTGRHILHAPTTYEWLARYLVPYDHIVFNKPVADYYIDNREIKFKKWDSVHLD